MGRERATESTIFIIGTGVHQLKRAAHDSRVELLPPT
jgi:hypothetical protein